MRIRELMFLFGVLFLLISGIALVKEVGRVRIFGLAISEKVAFMPSSSLFYIILIFILSIIMIIIALTERKIIY
ncbi:MAG: hypothetical protein QXP53_00305 [Candidatus Pacearchaeota archaeon]